MSNKDGHSGERVIEEIRSLAIPPGWAKTTIGDVGDVRLGRQRSPKNRSADFPTKYVRAANITWAGLDLRDILDMEFRPGELASYRLQLGDLLLSEASGSASEVGKSAIWNNELQDCCFQNTVIRFRPKAVTSKFALAVFQHFARNSVFARVSKGVGIHHLSADRFASMPFLLPPLSEQDRIVAKIEELFSDLDAGVAALKRARANLKRYRAAVLKAAVEGKLTEEWRAKHPNAEPASKLLARILTERRQKWEADQLAKFAAANKEPPKNWKEKYVEPTPPDLTGLSELPAGWCWASVEQLFAITSGEAFKKNEYSESGARLLQIANVGFGEVLWEQQNWLPLSYVKDYPDLVMRDGDIVLALNRPILRDRLKVAQLTNADLPAILYQRVARLRTFNEESAQYIYAVLNGPTIMLAVKSRLQGTDQPYLNTSLLPHIPLPFPSVAEQKQIVADVEAHLSTIAATEQRIRVNLLRAAQLRQSILRHAFEGKVVPQESKDEPASVLLERLRESRLLHEGNGKVATPPGGHRAKSKQTKEGANA